MHLEKEIPFSTTVRALALALAWHCALCIHALGFDTKLALVSLGCAWRRYHYHWRIFHNTIASIWRTFDNIYCNTIATEGKEDRAFAFAFLCPLPLQLRPLPTIEKASGPFPFNLRSVRCEYKVFAPYFQKLARSSTSPGAPPSRDA